MPHPIIIHIVMVMLNFVLDYYWFHASQKNQLSSKAKVLENPITKKKGVDRHSTMVDWIGMGDSG